MAKIVTITNPLTGQPAQVDQLDHTAQQIDDGLNIARNVSNPNLLDNWYFANPVNQRGQTLYPSATKVQYTIDRWLSRSWYVETKVMDGYIQLTETTGTQGKTFFFEQVTEQTFIGKKTLSIMLNDGTLYWLSGSSDIVIDLVVDGKSFQFSWMNSGHIVRLSGAAGATIAIKAVKLELGDQQTLAHQENGNWVLNEIPNYADMMERCQYYSDLPTTWVPMTFYVADFIIFTVKTHREMRVNLSSANVTLDSRKLELHSNGAAQSGFTFSVYGGGDDFILVKAAKSGHGLSNAMLIVNNGGIYANANM